MSDLSGRLQLIGEWADGTLTLNDEGRMLDMNTLNEILQRRVNEVYLQLLMAGMMAILGISREEGLSRYALEILVPLTTEEGDECDLEFLDRRTSTLKDLKSLGFYLEVGKGGSVRCYREGDIDKLEDDLSAIEAVLIG